MIVPIAVFSSPEDFNQTINSSHSFGGIGGVDSKEDMIVYMVMTMLPFFMMLPAISPIIISSYSIIGEKKNRTPEPLLAAPITIEDIMIGKTLSAIIPALLATWIAAILYAGLVLVLTYNIVHRILVPDMVWAIGLLVLAPLIVFFGVMVTLIISSRVNDPRTAQQVSVIFVLPLLLLLLGQMSGLLMLSPFVMFAVCVVALLADVAVVKIGSELFEREKILTRWK
jgi:ABC-2 type transport system permease protein